MPEGRSLLVEDEPTTREILTQTSRQQGYEVDSVATASAAITCLEGIRYALVIADWVLPDGDGIDVADEAVQRGCKTLIVSGRGSDFPPAVADRHELLSKERGHTEIMAAVRRAIGNPASNRDCE